MTGRVSYAEIRPKKENENDKNTNKINALNRVDQKSQLINILLGFHDDCLRSDTTGPKDWNFALLNSHRLSKVRMINIGNTDKFLVHTEKKRQQNNM